LTFSQARQKTTPTSDTATDIMRLGKRRAWGNRWQHAILPS